MLGFSHHSTDDNRVEQNNNKLYHLCRARENYSCGEFCRGPVDGCSGSLGRDDRAERLTNGRIASLALPRFNSCKLSHLSICPLVLRYPAAARRLFQTRHRPPSCEARRNVAYQSPRSLQWRAKRPLALLYRSFRHIKGIAWKPWLPWGTTMV